jgi:hypothetical protein
MTESSTIKNIGDNVRAERHYHRTHEKCGVDYTYVESETVKFLLRNCQEINITKA